MNEHNRSPREEALRQLEVEAAKAQIIKERRDKRKRAEKKLENRIGSFLLLLIAPPLLIGFWDNLHWAVAFLGVLWVVTSVVTMVERPITTVRIVACTVLVITNGIFLVGYFAFKAAQRGIEEKPGLVSENFSADAQAADAERRRARDEARLPSKE